MANRKVTFELDADEAKALDGFRKIINVQKKAAAGAEQMGRRQDTAFVKNQKSAGGYMAQLGKLRSMLVGGAVAAGVGKFVGDMTAHMDKQHQVTAQFEKDITGLLSLGDNVDNIQAIKSEVIALSNVLDLGTDPVSRFLFNLQSGTDGLDSGTVRDLRNESIELSRVTGDDLPISLQALIKTYRIYEDELGSVNLAQNKLFSTAEKGNITFGEMATLLPDVLPAAKAFGFTFDDVASSIITATQVGGKNEKTMTGLRNVYLRMNNAQKEGITLTGDYVDRLDQLSQIPQDTLLKIFGAEAITVINNLINNTDQLAENLEGLSAMESSFDGVAERLDKRADDERFRLTSAQSRNKRAVDNSFASERFGRLANEYALSRRGARMLMPGAPEWMANALGTLDATVMTGAQMVFTPIVETLTGKDIPKVMSDMQRLAAQSDLNDLHALGDIKELQRAAENEYSGYGNFGADYSGLIADRGVSGAGGVDVAGGSSVGFNGERIAESNRDLIESNRELAESNRELIESNRDRAAARSGVVSGSGVRVGGQRPVGVE